MLLFSYIKVYIKSNLVTERENSYGFVRLSQGCRRKRLAKALVVQKAQSFACLRIWHFVILGFMCSACKRLYHLVPTCTLLYLGGFIELHQSRLVLASINGGIIIKVTKNARIVVVYLKTALGRNPEL